jgi:hypothetical protein
MILVITIKDGVVNEALSFSNVKKAEVRFTKEALKLGAKRDDMDVHLDDGFFAIANASVCLVHPSKED